MKGLLACLCWLLAGVGYSIQTLSESPGQTFTYEVESTVLTGIPESANQYAGLSLIYELKVDVVKKDKAIFRIQDVRVAKLNEELPVSYAEDVEFQYKPSPHYERALEKPIIVYFNDHQVDKFEALKSDPTWSVNIKKALVEKFQVDFRNKDRPVIPTQPNEVPTFDPKSAIFTTYEDGIGGECETRYSILSVQSLDDPDMSEDVLNITKVKNYRNCRSRPVFEFDNIALTGSPSICDLKHQPLSKNPQQIWRESSSAYDSGCRFGFEPDHRPVKSYSIAKYNISNASNLPIIEGILAEGKTVYSLNGKEILVIAQQNITLVKTSSLHAQLPSIPDPTIYETLEYELPEEDYLDTNDSRIYALYGPVDVPELVRVTIRQLEHLVNGMIPTEPETSRDAGTKIIQLVNALNLFKEPELETIFQQLHSNDLESVPRKQRWMRKVYLDLLAIAATDDVALFVRNLILHKRVQTWEAAELVEGIGKNSDDPAPAVIKAYIALLKKPEIQKSRHLFNSLAITVGKMVQDLCVDQDEPQALYYPEKEGAAEHYPYSLKKTQNSEEVSQEAQEQRDDQPEEENVCTPEMLREFVQNIAEELKSTNDINEIIMYVEALAHMGTSYALPYLVPYVKGEAINAQVLDDEDTDFLRSVSIYTLHHIAPSYPDEVLPLMAEIYFDPSEDYELRIAAFSVIMATQPPLTLLERIATELHDETNNQVGSYVYSLLSDLANSTLPYQRKMAQKIQLILAHAPDFDLGMQYSSTWLYTNYDDDNDFGASMISKYVASNVSSIPRGFYSAFNLIRGPFRDNILQFGGIAKGADELLDKLFEPKGILSQILSSLGSNAQVHSIPEVLDLVRNRILFRSQDVDTPRAILYYKLFGRTTYLTLDEQYVIEVLEQVVEYMRQIDLRTGYNADYVKVWMPTSFFRAVPSTVGLPVVVNHRIPIILTLSLGNTRFGNGQEKDASTFALSTNFDASLHMDNIILAYVVDPVHDELLGASIEKTSEVAIATQIEFIFDLIKDTYALRIQPKLPHEILYHNLRPATFIAPADIITEPKQEWLEHVNEIETVPEPFKLDRRLEARPLGLSLRLSGESESPWDNTPLIYKNTAVNEGIFAALQELIFHPINSRELRVFLEPHKKNALSELLLTIDYDKHLQISVPETEKIVPDSSSEEEEYEKAMSSIYGRSYSAPDAQTVIENLVKKTQATWAPILGHSQSDPVPATVSHVVDVTLAVKADRTLHHAWRAVYAHSLDYRSNWFELVGHRSGDEYDRPWQLCSSLLAVYPEIPSPFYLEMNSLKMQKAEVRGEIGWGSNCQQQNKIRVEGIMEKGEDQVTSSKQNVQSLPAHYKQCHVDRKEGLTQSYACQEAISDATNLDAIKIDFIAQSIPDSLKNVSYYLDMWAKYAFFANLEANPFKSNPEDRISVELFYNSQVPDNPFVDVYIHKPTESLAFSKLYMPNFEPPSTLDPYGEILIDQFYNDDYLPECNLMEDYLNTFDNVTVELADNKCQYLLAKDCSAEHSYTIIASQTDLKAKTKSLSASLAGHTVNVLPPSGQVVHVIVDGQEHQIEAKKPIVLDFDKDEELHVYLRTAVYSNANPVVVIQAVDDGITIEYDGKNARIQIPRDFQGDQCGMCGNMNGEQDQELGGPDGCVFLEEEDFVSSYAIPSQSCPQPRKPEGPAFCPSDVTYVWKKQKPSEESKESSEDDEKPNKSAKSSEEQKSTPSPSDDSNESKEIPKKPHVKYPKNPALPKESWDEYQPKQSQESVESSEIVAPEGPARCIQTYTPTFEFEDTHKKTCFATQPAYRCHPACRAVNPRVHKLPFHCLPQTSKYEKILKEQAKQGILHQLQNKKTEKMRSVEIPEKCL